MRIINNNALDALKELPYESVDCIITSPPYYGLRSYKGADTIWGGNPECEHEWIIVKTRRENGSGGKPSDTNQYAKKLAIKGVGNYSAFTDYHDRATYSNICSKCGAWKGQLGLEPTYQMYIEHLMMITRELKRVLKKTGTMFWNMGDSYAGNMGSRTGWQDSKYSETREQGIENGEAVFLKANYGNIPQKSLMMIPERFVIAMIDDGWILRNKIIWRKTNGMPSSVKDRFSNKWEYVFFFTKNKKYYFNLDAVRKPLKQSSINRIKQKNIPNQFKNGKSVDFGKEKPNMSIPRILNNMHQKYEQNSSYEGKHSGYFNEDGTLRANPKGANPGDVVEVPYAVQPRNKEYVEYRNLPNIKELASYLNSARKQLGLTMDNIEEIMHSQAPHHWFNGESYPTPEDWIKIKEILKLDNRYDNQMTKVFVKSSEKINNPLGANPGDIVETPAVRAKTWASTPRHKFTHKRQYDSNADGGDFFSLSTIPHKEAHFAVYPETLVAPLIKAGCPKEGTVLDPFAGSGTTGVVASILGRDSILIEISPEYCDIIRNRMTPENIAKLKIMRSLL